MGVDRDRTRGNERSGGKREREREGSMFNMTSKYLITSVTMSASQTRLPFSHIHQPSVSGPDPVSSCAFSVQM